MATRLAIAAMFIGLFMGTVRAELLAPALSPEQTVKRINDNYNRIKNDCKEVGTGQPRGHYYCSGVSIRMVNDGPFNPWDYSDYALKTGATSWSWIRADLSINTLTHPAGFIMRTATDAAELKLPVKENGWLCVYPFDAGTGPDRPWGGCGQVGSSPQKPTATGNANKNDSWAYGSCEELRINTANDWLQTYPGGLFRPIQKAQCSWSAENPAGWEQMIRVHEARSSTDNWSPYAIKTFTNEFMLRNEGTGSSGGSENMKYIDAFVYNSRSNNNSSTLGDTGQDIAQDGLTAARNFQKKLYAKGYAVPVLRIDFSRPASERFSYVAADQAITLESLVASGGTPVASPGKVPPGKYIASTRWTYQFHENLGRQAWSLVVVPTDYGRQIKEDETAALYDELLSFNGVDAQWVENEKATGSMRRQLVCLLVNFRDKSEWWIEPERPYVSHAQATAADCNPL